MLDLRDQLIMAKGLRERMTGMSEAELAIYLDNYSKYTPEAIKLAAEELKRRGRNFSDEELKEIDIKIEKKTKAENEAMWTGEWSDANIVTDLNAPLLYSKKAIRVFCLFFSTMFGAVLLSSNINDNKRKWIMIGFGVIYTAFSIVVLSWIPSPIYPGLLLNIGGGFGLTTTFWDNFVGKETKYRSKPIWKPLVISIVIYIPIILAIIYER
jgi:hypothetical protein